MVRMMDDRVASARKRRRKSYFALSLVIILFVMVGIPCGVYFHIQWRDRKFRQEMVQVVHSQEVGELIKKGLEEWDPHAFDGKGVINTYRIDDSSIQENPMGGVDFDAIVNDEKKFDVSFHVDRYFIGDDGYGPIKSDGADPSTELTDALEKRYGKGWSETDNAAEKYRKEHPQEFPTPQKKRANNNRADNNDEWF